MGESPNILTLPEQKTETATVPPWRVVVLNDPVNLMSYVVLVFKRVLGMSNERARKHMLEVHEAGRSVVWTGARERAELYVQQLQSWKLTAILENGSEN
ncbi:MAG: ATP-dependent Clp protease adaptor ClpS [Opitutales bacterium]|nr:ATP-dependent Clp protease adaptor ClpS [Opitutales bacterium]